MFDKSVSLFTVPGRLITDDEIDLGQVYISVDILTLMDKTYIPKF